MDDTDAQLRDIQAALVAAFATSRAHVDAVAHELLVSINGSQTVVCAELRRLSDRADARLARIEGMLAGLVA